MSAVSIDETCVVPSAAIWRVDSAAICVEVKAATSVASSAARSRGAIAAICAVLSAAICADDSPLNTLICTPAFVRKMKTLPAAAPDDMHGETIHRLNRRGRAVL